MLHDWQPLNRCDKKSGLKINARIMIECTHLFSSDRYSCKVDRLRVRLASYTCMTKHTITTIIMIPNTQEFYKLRIMLLIWLICRNYVSELFSIEKAKILDVGSWRLLPCEKRV